MCPTNITMFCCQKYTYTIKSQSKARSRRVVQALDGIRRAAAPWSAQEFQRHQPHAGPGHSGHALGIVAMACGCDGCDGGWAVKMGDFLGDFNREKRKYYGIKPKKMEVLGDLTKERIEEGVWFVGLYLTHPGFILVMYIYL